MLNLKNYLSESDDYCIIKISNDFPKYKHHSDIDIITSNANELAKLIKDRHMSYTNQNLHEILTNHHHQLDYYSNGLNLKFDLIDNYNFTKRIKVSSSLISDALKHSIIKTIDGFNWKVPSIEYETVFRYIEWIEYPHKHKHKVFYDYHKTSKIDKMIKEYTN